MAKKIINRREMPTGSVIKDPGCSMQYETGGWRNLKPVRDTAKCTNCLLCWIYCPDSCIKVKDGKIAEFDLKYCKGCGICAVECPVKGSAIQMVEDKKE